MFTPHPVLTTPIQARGPGYAEHPLPASRAGAATSQGLTGGPQEEHLVVTGYLSAVAEHLGQRAILVRELHTAAPTAPYLAGHLDLSLPPATTPGWKPTRLDWDETIGWSATLTPPAGHDPTREPGTLRYLPRRVAPAPLTVAHFVTALIADARTIWASYIPHPPARVDRRWLILQLSRFTAPEPG